MLISFHQTKWHHVPEDSNLHNYHKNLKPYVLHVLGKFFWLHYDPKVDSASNRYEYQQYFLGVKAVGLTTLPPLCDDCYEIWEPQPPGTLRACPGPYMDYFTFY